MKYFLYMEDIVKKSKGHAHLLGYCDVTKGFSGSLAKKFCRVSFFAHFESLDMSPNWAHPSSKS